MAVVYDTGDYHSVSADHADFTLPDGNWFWAIIIRPDSATGGQDILSTGEWGTAGTYNFYQFDTDFGFKYEATTERLVTTVSAGNYALLVAQRSGGNLSLRSVPMGSTTVTNSGNLAISGSVNPSSTLHMGRRADNGDAPFNGALSDAFFVPGQTISDADMQAIATGTAIDSFSWYSSRVFWNIAGTSTQLDQTGDHTITANGTLVSTADHASLVRFSGQTIAVTQVTENNTAQAVTPVKPIISTIGIASETDTALAMSPKKIVTIGQVTENNTAQDVTTGAKIIGTASETDTAQAMAPVKPIITTVGQVTENSTAQGVTVRRGITIGQVTENNTAQAVAVVKSWTITLNTATETDTALAMTPVKPILMTVGQVVENSTVQGVTVRRGATVGQVTENNTAQSVTAIKPIFSTINPATETDTALAMTALKTITVGQVVEENLAHSVSIDIFYPVLPTNAGADLYFLFDNALRDAATFTATNTATDFDIDNTLTDSKTEIYRSTSAADQTITATWSTAKNISAVAMGFTNLVRAGSVQIKLYTNVADPDPIYDSGAKTIDYAYPPPRGLSTIGLDAFAYGGGTYFSHLFSTYQVKKLELIISNSANPDGYIEVAHLIAGKAFTPNFGAAYGVAIAPEDTSEITRTDSGNLSIARGTINKVLRFNTNLLDINSRRELMEMVRHTGRSSPVFISAHETATGEERQSHMIYGVFTQLPAPQLVDFERYNNNVDVTEV